MFPKREARSSTPRIPKLKKVSDRLFRIGPIEEKKLTFLTFAALLKFAKDILKYNKNYISGFELNATLTKVLYNPPLIHSLPVSITTYSNVLLRTLANSNSYQIETVNYPVFQPEEGRNSNDVSITKEITSPLAKYFMINA